MKIAILGYGKMGKTIEQLALDKGHEIVLRIDDKNVDQLTADNLRQADVAIEFTRPEAAVGNIGCCFDAGVPVVSGTTGWLDQMAVVKERCESKNGGLFYASNYSVGVNIFFAINRQLAKMMNEQPQYTVDMEEIHHTQKLDAPSGTAITLAEGIMDEIKGKTSWVNEATTEAQAIPIISKRIDKVPGTHSIRYRSAVDDIEICHTAHSRLGFASGALLAAEWMVGRSGVYGMKDLLGF
ncbi:MAG: 4-hydroxy-tetrahydrodipicolinate reductase [Bacteroidota bacterium]